MDKFVVSSEIEANLLDSLLNSEYSLKLWSRLGEKYTLYDKLTRILLAFTASGTVAGWYIWEQYEFTWKFLSGLSAIIAIALPIISLNESLKTITNNYQKELEIQIDFNNLWKDRKYCSEKELREKYNKISEKEKNYQLTVTVNFLLKNSNKVKEECREEVLKARGIIEK